MAAKNHESEYDDPIDDDLDHEDDELESNEDDEKVKSSESDEDERIVVEGEKSEEEEEREKIRERRREARKHKKEMQKAREQVLRSELSARDQLIENLSTRLNALENNGVSNTVSQIDAEINSLANAYVEARNYLEQGTEKQNGKLVAEATERMHQIRARAEQLDAKKQQIIAGVQRQQSAPPKPDPRLQTYAGAWMKDNAWYDPKASDRETMLVKSIDNGLAQEGWNPNTPEYWDELTERIKTALPNKFKTSYSRPEGQTSERKSPVAGSSRTSRSSSSGGANYSLSPERVSDSHNTFGERIRCRIVGRLFNLNNLERPLCIIGNRSCTDRSQRTPSCSRTTGSRETSPISLRANVQRSYSTVRLNDKFVCVTFIDVSDNIGRSSTCRPEIGNGRFTGRIRILTPCKDAEYRNARHGAGTSTVSRC